MTSENVVFMNPILLGICYLNIGFFFNFPPLSQSFIASQLEDVNCTDLGKTWCSSVHILCTVTRILGAEAFLYSSDNSVLHIV